MKKLLLTCAIAVIAICIASCGGNKSSEKSEDLTVDTLEIDTAYYLSSNSDSFDEENESNVSSSSSSQDWDALLDSYEQYVDKYISYMKKAVQGDMSAMAEYPALMEKAQEFSDKMEEAEDEMSTSQWSRYMKITNKMVTAAQQLQ